MFGRTALVVLCTFLAAAPLAYGADEGKLSRDGFTKIVSQIEDEEARRFFEGLAVGSSYRFPVVWDLADLTGEDLWMRVDDDEVALEKAQLGAFLQAMAEAGVTMKAGGEAETYRLRGTSSAGGGTTRTVGQEKPKKKVKSSPTKKKSKKGDEKKEIEAKGPTYRLSGLGYGDVVLSAAEDADKIFFDYEVAGVVDDLQFKDFPYNRDGDAQKLFGECEKKMEGLMSSASGRERVLQTYAYYDVKDQSWRADLLAEILDYYDLGKITKK